MEHCRNVLKQVGNIRMVMNEPFLRAFEPFLSKRKRFTVKKLIFGYFLFGLKHFFFFEKKKGSIAL